MVSIFWACFVSFLHRFVRWFWQSSRRLFISSFCVRTNENKLRSDSVDLSRAISFLIVTHFQILLAAVWLSTIFITKIINDLNQRFQQISKKRKMRKKDVDRRKNKFVQTVAMISTDEMSRAKRKKRKNEIADCLTNLLNKKINLSWH